MTKLEEEKIKEEINGLKVSRYTNILKGIAFLIGSIVLFIAIQMPESILNKRMSNESISRERAKLVLELIHNNKDYESILLELSVIEKAYPNEDNLWINKIKSIYSTKLDKNNNNQQINSIDITKNKRILELRKELKHLYFTKEQLQLKLIAELDGTGSSRKAGAGAVYKQLNYQVDEISIQIFKNEKEIKELTNK